MSIYNSLDFSFKQRLPVILQTEMAECGLACIAMVANYHGYETNMTTLRSRYTASIRGTTIQDLMTLAAELDLMARPLRIELEDLAKIKTPAILHWDMNHFVVLKSVNGCQVEIHDPMLGMCNYNLDKVSKHFTGVALEIIKASSFKEKVDKRRIDFTSFIKNINGLKRSVAMIFTLTVVVQLFAMLLPFFTQIVLDEVLTSSQYNMIYVLFGVFLFLLVFSLLAEYLRAKSIIFLSSNLSLTFESNLFHHMLKLPTDFFERRHIGDVVSRFSSLNNIREFLTIGVVEALLDGIVAVLVFFIMLAYSPKIALVVAFSCLLYLIIKMLFITPVKDSSNLELTAVAKQSSSFMETVRAIQTIKLFGKELDRQSHWQNHYVNYINASVKLFNINLNLNLITKFITYALSLVVVLMSAIEVIDQKISAGMLIAILAYKELFFSSASKFIDRVMEFKVLKLHFERIADIALAEREKNSYGQEGGDVVGAMIRKEQQGKALTVTNLSFSYDINSPPLFENLKFSVLSGETMAIVGPSGEGKSTLLKLLASLLELQGGDIEINNISLKKAGLKNYRRLISGVMQDDQLLSGSIMDNICFFDNEPDKEFAIKCARMAHIEQEINEMSMGFDTLVGDMGSSLSGGQKQRVLLARALYKRPHILFLDEATSHLDIPLEKAINDELKELNITKILVAHRRETIASADRIILLSGGKLINVSEQFH
jgi:ATP-binding cassette subfamily B protein RaxB